MEFASIGCVVPFTFYSFVVYVSEIMNMRNLERVLAREEEVKKKAVVHKDTYEGPTVRFFSRDGNFFIGLSSLICLRMNSEFRKLGVPYLVISIVLN
jgi:hypothetical protein